MTIGSTPDRSGRTHRPLQWAESMISFGQFASGKISMVRHDHGRRSARPDRALPTRPLPGPAGADILLTGASRHLAGDDDFASTMPLSTSIAFGASTGGLYFARAGSGHVANPDHRWSHHGCRRLVVALVVADRPWQIACPDLHRNPDRHRAVDHSVAGQPVAAAASFRGRTNSSSHRWHSTKFSPLLSTLHGTRVSTGCSEFGKCRLPPTPPVFRRAGFMTSGPGRNELR